MKKLFKNISFVLSVTLSQVILSGILVNNVDINTITTPEERGLIIYNNNIDENMIIIMKAGSVMAYNLSSNFLGFNLAQAIHDDFKSLQRIFTRHHISDHLAFQSTDIYFECFHLKGIKDIIFASSDSIILRDVLLEAPIVFIAGDKIEMTGCFVDSDYVEFKPQNKNSFFSSIRIFFQDKTQTRIQASIMMNAHFKGKETDIACCVTGVKRIEMQMLPEAFIYNFHKKDN